MNPPIAPYLTVKGADAAIAFYKTAFGAVETYRHPADDGKRLLHAFLMINGGAVMLSDDFPEMGGPPAPTQEKPAPVAISVALAAPAEVDTTFRRAVEAGAWGAVEPADVFWGDRFAILVDPFGHRWMLNAPLSNKQKA
jgi:PhnB protein